MGEREIWPQLINSPCDTPKHPYPDPRSQVFLRAQPHPCIKHSTNYHAMRRMKRVHHRLTPYPLQFLAITQQSPLTFMYSSHTSVKKALIPSSFLPSCNKTNFMSFVITIISTIDHSPHFRGSRLLPGVTNADTVHSLNLSTDLRYLIRIKSSIVMLPQLTRPFVLTSHCLAAPHLQSRPDSHWQSSGSHADLDLHPFELRPLACSSAQR